MNDGSVRRGGLEGVVLGPSGISLPDGREGRLWYRGYDAGELAVRLPYASIAYLLIWGEPPASDPPAEIEDGLRAGRALAQHAIPVLQRLPPTTPPLDAVRTGLSALGDGRFTYPPQRAQGLALAGAIAELLAARAPRRADPPAREGAPASHLDRYLDRVASLPPTPERRRALAVYAGLLADHGMNPSTFALRVVLSTRSDPVSAFVAALGALKGPAHGGAPADVSAFLDEIGTVDRIDGVISERLQRGGRLPGFGHRTYRVEDPRSVILHEIARSVTRPERLRLAEATDRAAREALARSYPGGGLFPNVDFYGSLVLEGVGLAPEWFTPTFAVARSVGWVAHALEQAGRNRLIQPEFEYDGPAPPRTWPRPFPGAPP
ncbi:MAG: citrate/2-methylcitrate synthase [Thermoplasmata archaeon]